MVKRSELRAGVYLRLSRDRDESTSIVRQRESCEQYAAARGWVIVGEAVDVDVSGSKVAPADRPGFSELLHRDDLDVLLCYRLDRVARNVLDFSDLVRLLDARGVGIVSATEPFDTSTSAGKALTYLVAVFAEMESDAISARVRSSIGKLAGTRWPSGRPPYGYRVVPASNGAPGKVLDVDEAEAAVIRDAAAQVLAGVRLGTVVRELNERQVPTRLGTVWQHNSLLGILTGDALLGRVKRHGRVMLDDDGHPLQPWPAILELSDVEQLRIILDPTPVKPRSSRLLSGLVYCSECGRRMSAANTSRPPMYRCDRRRCTGTSSPAIAAEQLEQYVEQHYLERHGEQQVMRRSLTQREPVGLADVSAQLEATIRAAIDAEGAERDELLSVADQLKARRADLLKPRGEPVLEPLGITVADLWVDQPAEHRRTTLTQLGLRVTVKPTGTRGRHVIDFDKRVTVSYSSGTELELG